MSLAKYRGIGRKIVAAAKNYSEHAAEMKSSVPKEPVVFLKPTSSYITEGMPIKAPKNSDLHHEVELGLVIGKSGSCIREDRVMDHIGGYILALDMTNRTEQSKAKEAGYPWSVAKGFDTSCPVSEFIPPEKITDPHNLRLWLKVNGVTKQDGNTKDMVFKIPYLVSWISNHFTLETGDVILTGTPHGVGPVVPGDKIECGLSDIMDMTFMVEAK